MKSPVGSPRTPSDKPLAAWFKSQGWKPLPFQRELWRHYLHGHSGLLHTPTGSGKTLAAFGGPLLEALAMPTTASSKKNATRELKVLSTAAEKAVSNPKLRSIK
ncbi:MAG: DNA ligase-associated DEXH box helicase, partial [Pseudoxanthomonas sp.]